MSRRQTIRLLQGATTVDISARTYLVFEAEGPDAAGHRRLGAPWRYFADHPQVQRRFGTDFEGLLGPITMALHIGVRGDLLWKYVANGACCMSARACFAQKCAALDRLFQIVQLIAGGACPPPPSWPSGWKSRNAPFTATVADLQLGRAHRRRSRRGLPLGQGSSCPPLMFSQGGAECA